jgi:asparagine synthase (glutamine-hydrolysing)
MLFTPKQAQALLFRSTTATDDDHAGHSGEPSWIEAMEQLAERAEMLEGQSVVRYLELGHYMRNTLLRDTDAMSMHHSLELRLPLLDDRIVAFVRSLPGCFRPQMRATKVLLSEAVKDLLPAEILKRSKRPFTLPWEHWLRGALGGEIAAQLRTLTPSLASTLNTEMVDSIWTDFLSNRTGWARPWSLFVLNEWVRMHIDKAASQIEPRSNSVTQLAAT